MQAEYNDGPVQIHLDLLTDYAYDGFGRLERLVRHGTSFSGHAYVDFGYNAASELETIDRYRFAPTANPIHTATTTYERDATTGWLTSLVHAQDTTELARYDYTHDAVGRIVSLATLDDERTFDYDEGDQLISVDHDGAYDEAYGYDDNGNRVSSHDVNEYTTGVHNRLVSDGTYAYDYDAAGNLIRRTTVATGESIEYDWDHRGRLVRVTSLDDEETPTSRVDYFYDHLDRRIAKAIDETGVGEVDEASLAHFVYDGANVLLQLTDVDGVGGTAARVMHRYLYGPLVDQVLLDNHSPPGVPATMDWLC